MDDPVADEEPMSSSAPAGLASVTSNHMLNAKLTRRKVQQDVELLSNRIERLRAEERKARQKVLDTKLRGQEIIALQKRNEQAAAAKQLAKRIEEDMRAREMQQQQMRRMEQRMALKSTLETMHAAKREDVQAERVIKKENSDMVRQMRQYQVDVAKKNREVIRTHQRAVQERFDKQREAHQEFLAQDFINMIAQEDKQREQVEKEIAEMEKIERNHIERLRTLQDEQKAAYDALEEALAS